MDNNVSITSKGIRKVLRNYNNKLSFVEYVWNGFDAKADTVEINYSANELGTMEYIEVIDNGYGIDFDKLATKFKPFYDSEKTIEISAPKHTSAMHGKNGVGRLSFFTFAHTAEWITTFRKGENLISGKISMDVAELNNYKEDLLEEPVDDKTGTKVTFTNVLFSVEEFESSIYHFLLVEFCWFLELNKDKGYKIIINGNQLDYSWNIAEIEKEVALKYKRNETSFEIEYIQWNEALHQELSKFYFINSKGNEVYKDYTSLNHKGDQFYHSVFIKSSLFDDFDFKSGPEDRQVKLLGGSKSSAEYRFLIKKVNEYLRVKRKPFLKEYAYRLVEQFEQEGVFPVYKYEWEEKFKKPQLQETLIGLYEAQPKLFVSLNLDQKKTFVRFLDLLLDSNERDKIFEILDEVVELEPEEREDFARLFKTTRLNRIIETIKLIEDRHKTYYQLRDLVYNPDLKADEVHHLQKLIENHYWFFGEQYHLLTAAEPKFDEALRRYHHLLYQEDIDKKVNHPYKYKEMDIFACRQNTLVNKIENIVVELKHPNIKIGGKQYFQVDKYLQAILSEPLFNAQNMSWEFYLIANDFDTSGFLERQIESNANHGIAGLVLFSDKGRIKVYAKKWSEIFTEFEIRHKYLDDKLKLDRTLLTNELRSAGEVVRASQANSAIQPKEYQIADAK